MYQSSSKDIADLSKKYDQLYLACKNGYKEVIELFLKDERIDLNKADNHGRTPFHFVCGNGNKEVIELFLKDERIDPNKADNDGFTPLHFEYKNGDKEVIELLLKDERIDPNKADNDGFTPFHFQCSNRDKEVIELFLKDERVDPNKAGNYGQTPFHFVCGNGNKEVIELFLKDERIDPNKANDYEQTPFYFVCKNGNKEVIELFLKDERIDPNKAGNDGWTPFSLVCRSGNKEVIELLLKDERIDPNKAGNDGWTPFHFVCRSGNKEVIELLLKDERIDPNKADNDGWTPFYFVCKNGNKEVIELLLKDKRIDPNKADNDGQTPFHFVCKNGDKEVIELFLSNFIPTIIELGKASDLLQTYSKIANINQLIEDFKEFSLEIEKKDNKKISKILNSERLNCRQIFLQKIDESGKTIFSQLLETFEPKETINILAAAFEGEVIGLLLSELLEKATTGLTKQKILPVIKVLDEFTKEKIKKFEDSFTLLIPHLSNVTSDFIEKHTSDESGKSGIKEFPKGFVTPAYVFREGGVAEKFGDEHFKRFFTPRMIEGKLVDNSPLNLILELLNEEGGVEKLEQAFLKCEINQLVEMQEFMEKDFKHLLLTKDSKINFLTAFKNVQEKVVQAQEENEDLTEHEAKKPGKSPLNSVSERPKDGMTK